MYAAQDEKLPPYPAASAPEGPPPAYQPPAGYPQGYSSVGQPAYPQQSYPIVAQQPQGYPQVVTQVMKPMDLPELSEADGPVQMVCPGCNVQMFTRTNEKANSSMVALGVCLGFFASLICCCLPLCIMRDVEHYCSACGRYLGRKDGFKGSIAAILVVIGMVLLGLQIAFLVWKYSNGGYGGY